MGEAKKKRDQEEERRAAEARRRQEERARWNAPKGRRGWRPMVIRVQDPEKPGLELGTFHLHADGKVYTVPGPRNQPIRRIKDSRIVELVHARYDQLHPKEANGAAPALKA